MTDGIALLRALGALLTVLGILGGALWVVRRYNITLPGSVGTRPGKRLAVVERLSLDPRRSLALLRRDGVEHLVLIAPEGHLVIESRIIMVEAVGAASPLDVDPKINSLPARHPGSPFLALVEKARRQAKAPEQVPVAASHDQHA